MPSFLDSKTVHNKDILNRSRHRLCGSGFSLLGKHCIGLTVVATLYRLRPIQPRLGVGAPQERKIKRFRVYARLTTVLCVQ